MSQIESTVKASIWDLKMSFSDSKPKRARVGYSFKHRIFAVDDSTLSIWDTGWKQVA